MKHLISHKLFESADYKYSDRDVTNKYFCAKGWVRYTKHHKDSYINIEKYFDITWDHLGWVIEDFVKEFDMIYRCQVLDNTGSYLDSSLYNGIADNIEIQFLPNSLLHKGLVDSKFKYSSKRLMLEHGFIDFLSDIENKLEENFPYLTIKNNEEDDRFEVDLFKGYNIFISTTCITLKIKRK